MGLVGRLGGAGRTGRQAWERVRGGGVGRRGALQANLWLRVAAGVWGQGRRDSAGGSREWEGHEQASLFKGCCGTGEVVGRDGQEGREDTGVSGCFKGNRAGVSCRRGGMGRANVTGQHIGSVHTSRPMDSTRNLPCCMLSRRCFRRDSWHAYDDGYFLIMRSV